VSAVEKVLDEELKQCQAEIIDIDKALAELEEKKRLLNDRVSYTISLIEKVKKAVKANPKM
jgi:cob(I)alamin adenosyltransferase